MQDTHDDDQLLPMYIHVLICHRQEKRCLNVNCLLSACVFYWTQLWSFKTIC